jgi:antirestriction protein ArdC
MERAGRETQKFDLYGAITAKIADAIAAGAGEFVMPWHRSGPGLARPTNAYTGAPYRGVNVVALWAEATMSGFSIGCWASYEQWKRLGAQVRRDQHGAMIVFYKRWESEEADENGAAKKRPRLMARASRVFNADQVVGWTPPEAPAHPPAEALPDVERLLTSTRARVAHGGERACYRLADDTIEMPARERFVGTPTSSPTQSYYAVLLHELTHWTGAGHRLGRTFGEKFGDAAYAAEELVAELGSAFLCADLGVANAPRPDHAAYVGSWLQILKADSKAIFTAASLAHEAATYLQKLEDAGRST